MEDESKIAEIYLAEIDCSNSAGWAREDCFGMMIDGKYVTSYKILINSYTGPCWDSIKDLEKKLLQEGASGLTIINGVRLIYKGEGKVEKRKEQEMDESVVSADLKMHLIKHLSIR